MNPELLSPQMAIFALFWGSVIALGYWGTRRAKKWREDFERALREMGFEGEVAPPDVRARFAVALEEAEAVTPPTTIFRRRDMKGELWVAEWQVRYSRAHRKGRWSREWLFALQMPGVNLPRLSVYALPAKGIGSLLAKAAALLDHPGQVKVEWPQKPTNAAVFSADPAAAQAKLKPAVFEALAGLGWATLHAGGSTAAVNSSDFYLSRTGATVDRAKLTALIGGVTRVGGALRD